MRVAEAHARLATKSGQRYSIPSNCAKQANRIFPSATNNRKIRQTDLTKRFDRHIFLIFVRLEKPKQT